MQENLRRDLRWVILSQSPLVLGGILLTRLDGRYENVCLPPLTSIFVFTAWARECLAIWPLLLGRINHVEHRHWSTRPVFLVGEGKVAEVVQLPDRLPSMFDFASSSTGGRNALTVYQQSDSGSPTPPPVTPPPSGQDACNPNPCDNAGQCDLDPGGGHICTCASGFGGMSCQFDTTGIHIICSHEQRY